MADVYTTAGVAAALILASADVLGLFLERSKRNSENAGNEQALKHLEEGVKKLGEAVVQLGAVAERVQGLAEQIRATSEAVRAISGHAAAGLKIAEQGAFWSKVGTALNAVRLFLEYSE